MPANLTSGEAAHLDRAGGKLRRLQVGTRIRDLELSSDPTTAGMVKVVASEAVAQYELVAATGYDTTNAAISVNLSDADNNRMTIGFAPEAIGNGSVGYIARDGIIAGNTSGAGAVGDPVYVDEATPGGWTLTAGTGSDDIKQIVGYVAVKNATGYIAVSTGAELPAHDHADASGGGAITMPSVTDLDVGADGTAGTLDIFPSTGTNSKMIITCTDIGAGSRNLSITNAAQAAARTYTIPDAGASADFLMTGTTTQSKLGDLILGSDTVAGELTVNSVTASKGSSLYKHQDDSNDKVTTVQNNSTTTGGACTLTLPSTTGTLLGTGTGNPAADVVLGGDLQLGEDAVEGLEILYPATTNSGTLTIQAVDNGTADVDTKIQNAQAAAGTTVTLPAFTSTVMSFESAQRFIPLSLLNCREVVAGDPGNIAANGGILASDTTPILEAANAGTDNVLRINWVAGNTNILAISTALPPDLDTSSDVVLHMRATTGGTTDTVAFTIESWWNEGDTTISDATGNLTQNDTYAEITATIAAGDVPAGAQTVTFNITPGAHGNDTVLLNVSAWLEYTGAALTS